MANSYLDVYSEYLQAACGRLGGWIYPTAQVLFRRFCGIRYVGLVQTLVDAELLMNLKINCRRIAASAWLLASLVAPFGTTAQQTTFSETVGIDSSEWRVFLELMGKIEGQSPLPANLESACIAAVQSIGPNVSVSTLTEACIDAASRLGGTGNWYRRRVNVIEELNRLVPFEQPHAALKPGLGLCIRLPGIQPKSVNRTAVALRVAVKSVDAGNNVVLDLRGNKGGNLIELQELASLFLPKGKVFGKANSYFSYELVATPPREVNPEIELHLRRTLQTAHLAVLVDRQTANGAEMLAQGLRRARNALIFGEATAGSNELYYVRSLKSPEFIVMLRNGTLRDVDGSSWGAAGIQPDIPIAEVLTEISRASNDCLSDPGTLSALQELGRVRK